MKKSIILVHGAWADGSNWRKVIPLLTNLGHEVIAAQIPLTSFVEDVGAVKRAIEHASGEVVLVAHSYAGAVISAAGHASKVKGLAFITAYAPDEGETVGALRTKNPAHAETPILKPDQNGFVWMGIQGVKSGLAHDLNDSTEQELIVTTQKPIADKILAEPMPAPAWREKPSWYLKCTNDRMASVVTQTWMAERAKSKIVSIESGHMPLLTQPESVANIILMAVQEK